MQYLGSTYTKMLFRVYRSYILSGNSISCASLVNKITNSVLLLLTLRGSICAIWWWWDGPLHLHKHWEDFEPKVKD